MYYIYIYIFYHIILLFNAIVERVMNTVASFYVRFISDDKDRTMKQTDNAVSERSSVQRIILNW